MREELNKESLLKHVSQEDIFQKYMKHRPEIGNYYCNPLREDSNPGCWYWYNGYGTLFFIDNTKRREFGGDCFEMVGKICEVENFYEILRRINYDFRIGLDDGYLQDYKPVVRSADARRSGRTIRSKIKFTYMPFLKKDIKWWEQFCATEYLLNKNEIYCCHKVWINGNLFHTYKYDDPVYAYKFDDRCKIYRPFAERKKKWRSNCKNTDINGYKQLPETGELLIITKAMKDVLTLTSMDYNVISPQAEYPVLPEKLVKELKERFTRIVVFYDNDEAGVQNSIRLTTDIEADYVNIPQGMPKDPSDYVKKYSCEALTEYLHSKNIK